jgi:hypothetical protein
MHQTGTLEDYHMRAGRFVRRPFALPASILALSLALGSLVPSTAASTTAAERPGELNLTITYRGKGVVDDTHEIFVWVFDNPKIDAKSIPIAAGVVKKNGGAVKFADLAVSPVYIVVAYDEKGDYDGTQGPPPPGTPVAIYSTDGQGTPAPIDVKDTANVSMTFDDSQRMGG